jgi:predicted  nucleic acid-binding Zn-ribbon protein
MRRREFIAGLGCCSAIATRTVSWICAALLGACFHASSVAAADDPSTALNALQLSLENLDAKTRKRNEALKRVLDQIKLANPGTKPAGRATSGGQTQSIDLRHALANYQQSQDLITKQLIDKLGQQRAAAASNTGGGDTQSSLLLSKAASMAARIREIAAVDAAGALQNAAQIDTMRKRIAQERDAAVTNFVMNLMGSAVAGAMASGGAAGAGVGAGAAASAVASGLRTVDIEDRILLVLTSAAAETRKDLTDAAAKIADTNEKKKALRDVQAALRNGNNNALTDLLNSNAGLGEFRSAKHELRLARLHAVVATDVALTNLLLAYASRGIYDPKNTRRRELTVLDVVQGLAEQSRAKAQQQRDAMKQLLQQVEQTGPLFEKWLRENKRLEDSKGAAKTSGGRAKFEPRLRERMAKQAAPKLDAIEKKIRQLTEQIAKLKSQIEKLDEKIEKLEQMKQDVKEINEAKAKLLERISQAAAMAKQMQAYLETIVDSSKKLEQQEKGQKDAISELQEKIAEIDAQIQQLRAVAEKIQQVADKMEDLVGKFEEFVGAENSIREIAGPTELRQQDNLQAKLAQLKKEAEAVKAKIAALQAAIKAADERCRGAGAGQRPGIEAGSAGPGPAIEGGGAAIVPLGGGIGDSSNTTQSPAGSAEACQQLAQLLAELEALLAQLDKIQHAISRVLIEIAAADRKQDRKKSEIAKQDATPRLIKCPPTCPGGATGKPKPEVKVAKPVAASGGASGGGSVLRVMSPGLLDGGGGLSGGNTPVRGSPAGGGTTSNPGPGRATIR